MNLVMEWQIDKQSSECCKGGRGRVESKSQCQIRGEATSSRGGTDSAMERKTSTQIDIQTGSRKRAPMSRISVPRNHRTHCSDTNTYGARTEKRRDSGLHNTSREDAIPPLPIDIHNIPFSRRIPLTISPFSSRTIVLIHLDASTLSALTANPLDSPLSLPVSLLLWLLLSHCHSLTLSSSLQLHSLTPSLPPSLPPSLSIHVRFTSSPVSQ